jgi:nitroreductase
MMQNDLYKAIFKRKSIRKYNLNPLEEGSLKEIKAYLERTTPLYRNIKTEIKIVSKDGVKMMLPIKAPHYLVMTSEKKEGYLTNAGYILQQVDLFLSLNNIGSCYLGIAKPTKEIMKNTELESVMVMALGTPSEPVHRTDKSEFKRKPLSQITTITDNDLLLEPARLAPSATNSQPWYFTGGNGIIHAYCVKPNMIKAFFYEKLNKIDLGIALYHIAAAAQYSGKQIDFLADDTGKNTTPKGYYYIISGAIK